MSNLNIEHVLSLHGYGKGEDRSSNVSRDKHIYGVTFDMLNPNPFTSGTYIEEAQWMSPGHSWDNIYPFSHIRPVLLSEAGVITAELDPNDYSKKADGTPANITDGDNVMMEIPKFWFKIETRVDKLHIFLATYRVDDTFKALGHMIGDVEKNRFYISAYLGSLSNGKLKSWSDRMPLAVDDISTARGYARANGQRYQLMNFYQLTALQVLYCIRHRNLDSQGAAGKGYVEALSMTSTGNTNQQGLYHEEGSDGRQQMKMFGIEDLWGNLFYWIDGAASSAAGNLLTTTDMNKNLSSYTEHALERPMEQSGYIQLIYGQTELGFTPSYFIGSDSTHFSDHATWRWGRYPVFGAAYNSYTYGGVFSIHYDDPSIKASYTGARLAYM